MIGSKYLFGLSFKRSLVKKLPIAYVHNQSMFLKTSGLNHKWFMLHCLVFKEQLCLSKLSLQATRLLYRISFRLSRTFLFFFFCLSHLLQQGASNQGVFSCQADVSRRLVLYYRMMVHLSTPFSQKLQSFLSSCSKTKNAPITRCVILAIGGGTEIWTPDTAGMNRML